MIYFFCGYDSTSKNSKIEELKEKLFTSPDALKFDYEVLHAHKLGRDTFKKALIALPAIAKNRSVVVRNSEKLTAAHKKIAIDVMRQEKHPCILILDFHEKGVDADFAKKTQRFSLCDL